MDNQHRMIRGYRELTPDDVDMMNRIKRTGDMLHELIRDLEALEDSDKRWISIGATHLQQGGMALTRSVAKPDFFF